MTRNPTPGHVSRQNYNSCQCMAKAIQYYKVKIKILKINKIKYYKWIFLKKKL